jgi:hypothetical protein
MRPATIVLLTLLATLPLPAAQLGTDTWRQEKRHQTLDGLRHWSRITEPDSGIITEERGRRFLRLRHGAKMQSIGVMPYGAGVQLRGVMDITSPGGAAGFGFIDFSSGVYYYLYLDKGAGNILLQRGDGETSEILAQAPASPASPAVLELAADTTDKKSITLRASLNGNAVLNVTEDKPPKLGSTYQIYVGISSDAEVDLYEMTTILRR